MAYPINKWRTEEQKALKRKARHEKALKRKARHETWQEIWAEQTPPRVVVCFALGLVLFFGVRLVLPMVGHIMQGLITGVTIPFVTQWVYRIIPKAPRSAA